MTVALEFSPLTKAKLICRYKRFLADCKTDDGSIITAHCPNTGAMTGCMQTGGNVYLSYSNNPKRKHAYTWELAQMPTSLVGINTLNANRLVKLALTARAIPQIKAQGAVTTEAKIGQSRLDFKVGNNCYIEVKNCTLVDSGTAMFPDAVTIRGQKHLRELMQLQAQGVEAVIFYLVQRMDATVFCPAAHVDSEYTRLLKECHTQGVKILAYDTLISPQKIMLGKQLKVDLP